MVGHLLAKMSQNKSMSEGEGSTLVPCDRGHTSPLIL